MGAQLRRRLDRDDGVAQRRQGGRVAMFANCPVDPTEN